MLQLKIVIENPSSSSKIFTRDIDIPTPIDEGINSQKDYLGTLLEKVNELRDQVNSSLTAQMSESKQNTVNLKKEEFFDGENE